MTRKYLISIIFLCLFSSHTMAQNGISTSLYTGRMSYTIPIYTIDDPDFNINIELRYQSEGFKPFQPSGIYGQDWTLVAGGRITRIVQDFADEHQMNYDDCYSREIGMFRAIRERATPIKEEMFDFTSNYYYGRCGIMYDSLVHEYQVDGSCQCGWKGDYMPDIYNFSFCGHEGRFTINNKGVPIIINGDFIDIDLSNFKVANKDYRISDSYYYPEDSSSITIRTTDGYTFVFGGVPESVEYDTKVFRNRNREQQIPATSTWNITKIIATNGRTITFNYIKGGNYLRSFVTDFDWAERQDWDKIEYYEQGDTTDIVYSLHKECLLESIVTSDEMPLTISFSSHPESSKMYENDDFTYCEPVFQLDSVLVIYNEDTLKTAKLSYQYRFFNAQLGAHPNYYWRYLREVSISGGGKYTMTYEYLDPYANIIPHPVSLYYPGLYPHDNEQFKEKVDRFGFWRVCSLQGMLREVTLPTGGKVKFTYGNHQYGEERRFCVTEASDKDVQLKQVFNEDKHIGGARIEKIETFEDEETLVETKTFSYKNATTGQSTGIFYNIFEVFNENNNHCDMVLHPYSYSMITSHIGYSFVEELTTIGVQTSKMSYSFDTGLRAVGYTSYNNNYINRDTTAREAINHIPDTNYYDKSEVFTGDLTYDGYLISPGKLIKTESFLGEFSTPVKSIQYIYNNGPTLTTTPLGSQVPVITNILGCLDTIVCMSILRADYDGHRRGVVEKDYRPANVTRKLFVCPDVLEKVIIQEYVNGHTMGIITNYSYDNKLRKKKIMTTNSRGISLFTIYIYPDDIPGADVLGASPSPLFMLINDKRIGEPVETISGFIENETEYITNGTIKVFENNTYGEPISPGIGALHILPYLHQTHSLALSEPITDYQPMSMSGGQVSYDQRYRLTCEYNFDLMYRPLSIKPFGKMATTYTWNGIYPTSKTVGNQTTTYTFIPHVGVNSITDPRGITTYYSYDSAGRLVEEYQIINGTKQVLNAYKYHIKTE